MKKRNLYALSFFGGGDVTEDDYRDFGRKLLAVWPSISLDQIATAIETAKNFAGDRVEVYFRPNSDVLIIHAYGAMGECTFHAKIEREGSYS